MTSNVETLSEEKIAEFRCAFQLFDEDSDGKITTKELGGILKKLGYSPTDEDLKDMIKEVDTDGNGNVDFQEFLQLMCCKMKDHDSEEEMLEAFKIFDRDSNGYVTKDDFKVIMNHLGEAMTPDELDEMIKDNDDDGDGQLNYEEFKKMMTFK
jgi:calmodulin